MFCWELRNIYHHHPESKKRKSSEANSGSIHPYGRYENAVKTRKTISTLGLWPVKAIFEQRAARVEVDTSISPVLEFLSSSLGVGQLRELLMMFEQFWVHAIWISLTGVLNRKPRAECTAVAAIQLRIPSANSDVPRK